MDRNKIKRSILDKYVLGQTEKLPSENKLALEFGVHRLTMRSILKELRDLNLIFPWHGKGWYPIQGNSQVVVNTRPVKYEVLENTTKAAGVISEKFRCSPHRNLGYFRRVVSFDDTKAIERYEETYFNLAIVGQVDNSILEKSFFTYINTEKTSIYISHTEFFSIPCPSNIAEILKIKTGEFVLGNLELTEDTHGKIITYSLNIFLSNSLKVNYKHNIDKVL